MHAPMMKAIETDMPDDIKQFTGVEESRVRGVETMAAIRAGLMKSDSRSAFYLSHENQVDLLEAWEDLVTRAETPDATNSKIASLEQECDRLKAEADKYKAGNEELNFALRMSEEALSKESELKAKWLNVASNNSEVFKQNQLSVARLEQSNRELQASNKELRKELSVLRRALNAANGVVGHFTGRK